jgi:FtsP/CotA-like multicopper oxidase with cupredoxin domain
VSKEEDNKLQQAPSRRDLLGGIAASASTFAFSAFFAAPSAEAQSSGCQSSENCQPAIGKELVSPGELKRGTDGFLRGVITVEAEKRNVTYYAGKNFFCKTHQLRAYHGYTDLNALRQSKPVTMQGVASPGPTLRAQVGDTVQLLFLNRIDTTCFNDTPLTGEGGGCEVAHSAAGAETYPKAVNTRFDPSKPESPTNPKVYVDSYPDCFRVSNTTNIHYHGTHTTPAGFGDNVLVGVLPNRNIPIGDAAKQCEDLFKLCTPTDSDPNQWREHSREKWDRFQAWYRTANLTLSKMGSAGAAAAMSNTHSMTAGEWPQYWPGYYPYYFHLPKYVPGQAYPAAGQTPGTHWYHAHQHGSTSIQLLNGMSGLIVITSPDYDGKLLTLGGGTPAAPKIKEKVLFLQLFAELTNMMTGGTPQSLCVNGQLQPVVSMKPGEVQWWRIGNGSIQSHGISTFFFLQASVYDALVAQFDAGQTPAMPGPSDRGTVPAIRPIAKDGVQFAWENYVRHAADTSFQLSPGNRIDYLIKAPQTAGDYVMVFWPSKSWPAPNGGPPQFSDLRNQVVLRARVGGTLAGENTEWYDPALPKAPANFPVFPDFLNDIPEKEINITRKVEFSMIRKNTQRPVFMIDGRQFNEGVIDKVMLEGDAEEWTLINTSERSVMHPFHIHINPFQIVEVFDPSLMDEPQKQPAKYIWQDTIAIPAGFYKPIVPNPDPTKTTDYKFVPGHIKIRHRFLDFTGKYVLHCHILGHEDRGMMQLIEVVPNKTTIKHH